MSHVVKRECTA